MSQLNQFIQNLPTKKNEAWKYTSLKSFAENSWSMATADNTGLSHDELKKISYLLKSEFYNFVFVNGFLNETLSDEFESWLQLSDEGIQPQNFKSYSSEQTFLNLSAEKKSVLKMSVPANKHIDKPVQFVFVNKSTVATLSQMNLWIDLQPNASAQVLVHAMNAEESTIQKVPCALNLSARIQLADQASMKWAFLQNENEIDYHFSRIEFDLSEGSQLTSLDIALGGQTNRHYVSTTFSKKNAFAGVYGLTALSEKQHTDHYTFIHHPMGENQSVQHYKSILTDEAHSVFRGRVRIEQDAQKANSEQLNNNLLLTRTAQAESIPQLEIYADDVKAGHGSTMGQLSADEIFYFLSRGISQTEAIRMLSFGYAKELVYKLENTELQNAVFEILNKKLGKMI